MISGLIASFGFAGCVLVDKYILSRRKIPQRLYIPVLFMMLCLFTGIIMTIAGIPIFSSIDLQPIYIVAFIGMITLAVAWNIYYYQAIAKETVQEFDLIMALKPLFTVLLAWIFFQTERSMVVFGLSLLASMAVAFAHHHHHRFYIDKYIQHLILAVLLMALEALLIRVLLEAFTPFGVYFLRTLFIFAAMHFIYKPDYKSIDKKDFNPIFLAALFGIMLMVASYYGYQNQGVVVTTLIMLLGPLIVEVYSVAILKEKTDLQKVISFSAVMVCVTLAEIIGYR